MGRASRPAGSAGEPGLMGDLGAGASGAREGPRSARVSSGDDLDVGDRVAQRSNGRGYNDGESGEDEGGESVVRVTGEHGVILRCDGAKVRRHIGRINGHNRIILFRILEQSPGATGACPWGWRVARGCENRILSGQGERRGHH